MRDSRFLPVTRGNKWSAAPSDIGTRTSQIPISSSVGAMPESSGAAARASDCTNSEAMASGSSIEAPRFNSAMPAESGFSMKASPPLRVIITLAARAMIGIIARAIRKAMTMLS